MLMTTLALLAAATATPDATPATAEKVSAMGPITATYHLDRETLCIRSGWNTATIATNRLVRRGECRTMADWNNRKLTFDLTPALQVRQARRASDQVASR